MSFVQFVPETSVTEEQAMMLQNFMGGFGTVYSPTGVGFMLQLVDVIDGRHLISGIVHLHLENRTTVQIVAVACTDPCRTEYRLFWRLLDEAGIGVVSVSVLFRNYERENRAASHVVAWCTSHGMVLERVSEDMCGNCTVKLSATISLLAHMYMDETEDDDDGGMTTYIPPACTQRQVGIANQCLAHMKKVQSVTYVETAMGKRLVARGPARVGTRLASKSIWYLSPVVG